MLVIQVGSNSKLLNQQLLKTVLQGRFETLAAAKKAIASLVRVCADATFALRAPSFTAASIEELDKTLRSQMYWLRLVLGPVADRVTVHQSLHIAAAIAELGECNILY
jgi:hypothetical protein